ncbi:MAG: LuxR C-terminal-related transcriptional regulator, partial [Dehalococcoidia bacterium]
THWPMLLDMAARTWTAGAGEETRDTALYFNACVAPVTAMRAFASARDYDVRALLPEVRARTLVLQRRDAPSQRLDVARGLAAAIPDAELQVLAGESASPFSGDIEGGVRAIEAFLGIEEHAAPAAAAASTVAPGGEALTAREAEVLALVARGRANKEIAAALGLSVHTVERHLTNLYPKIGCRSRTEAAAFALTHGYA